MAKGSIKIFKNGKYDKYFVDSTYDKVKKNETSDITLANEMTELQEVTTRLDKSCSIGAYGGTSVGNKTWFKVASYSSSNLGGRYSITFLVTHVMGPQGLLKIINHQDEGLITFKFMMNAGLSTNNFKLGYKIDSKNILFELYQKTGSSWDITHYKVLHESYMQDNKISDWTLYNNINNGISELPTDLTYITATNSEIQNAITGNAETASKLQTPRNIKISGDISGNADFDGSKDINIEVSSTFNTETLKVIKSLCKMVGMETTNSDDITSIATKLETFSDENSCLMYIPGEQEETIILE